MTTRSIEVTPELHRYLLSVSLSDSQVLRELRETTAQLPEAQMQIGPEQGQFIRWLVATIGARRTLEIGVFTGYSALITALALPTDGEVVAMDISAAYTDIAKPYWERAGVADRIKLHLAPALDTMRKLLDQGEAGKFDFAFIDADKENYLNYYEAVLQLLRPGGVIAVDNVLWSGRVIDPRDKEPATVALRQFNQKVAADQRVAIAMLPLCDGLTLMRKL